MSDHIQLSCGCRLTEVFVLGMCPAHAAELAAKKRESENAYRLFEQQMRQIPPKDGQCFICGGRHNGLPCPQSTPMCSGITSLDNPPK